VERLERNERSAEAERTERSQKKKVLRLSFFPALILTDPSSKFD
jgi:hypothetical protein